ncbi:MAG TPA: hypothetical protein VGG68_14825 [Caulobacteraceae bacterium]|jgi:predicted Fe-S protein YdhL (DUF1289 family)
MLRPVLAGASVLLVGSLIGSAVAAQPTAAQAPDPSSPAVRQACAADGRRLCVGVPREPREMTRCILQHWSELSAPCKSAVIVRRNELRAHPVEGAPQPQPQPH